MGFSQFLGEHASGLTSPLKVMLNGEATMRVWSGDTVAGVKADREGAAIRARQ